MIAVLPVDDRGKASGQPRDLPDLEAHDMIMAGRATLHCRQDEPPWILLSEAQKASSAMDRIGPPATSEALERICVDLLPSGVRQTTLKGAHVPWAHSPSKGEVAFRKALLGPAGPVPGLARQIGEVLSYRLARKRPVTFEDRPSAEEIETRGIIDMRGRDDAHWAGKWHCYEIGPEWAKFRDALMGLSKTLNEALETAFREGRILIVEELFPGGRLLHPDLWKEAEYHSMDYANDWFLLTRDLPADWFDRKPSRSKKRGRPPGSGGFEAEDAPFVDLIFQILDEVDGATKHGAVVAIVERHGVEISGVSDEAKVWRLMKRVGDLRN
jgi:hypothetical protein